jgi:hypothetical protein
MLLFNNECYDKYIDIFDYSSVNIRDLQDMKHDIKWTCDLWIGMSMHVKYIY